MSTELAAKRFSLRDLPTPAKLVVTCFLLAVGGGYAAAMVQLHMQDSKSGEALPNMHDVVLKYTGKKWFETEPPRPRSQFVTLITAPPGAPFNGTGTMFPAFTTRDGGEFNKAGRTDGRQHERLLPQREGERDALVLWAESLPDVRKQAFTSDHFGIDDTSKQPKAITPEFRSADGAYRVKSIIETRCARCHMPDGADPKAANFPLQTYEQIEKYLTAPAVGHFRSGGDWVRVREPISLEKLTQSTHAHLLSFAVLFSLTGLAFAFTSYPSVLRCVLGPLVLVALVADVSLWWLARLCSDWGPYFAMGILGTGFFSGVGLMLQITLSLFNMYGPKGKVVILLLFALGGAVAGLVYVNQIKPGLDAKQARSVAKADETKPDDSQAGKNGSKTDDKKNGNGNGGAVNVPPAKLPPFQRVLQFPVKGPDGKELAWSELKFKKDQDGGMVRAFFDKETEFAQAVKEKDLAAQQKLTPERHGEREALLAWGKLPDPERRKAFDADAFDLPPTLVGKPITPDYLASGKVKVKTLVTQRCISCHESEDKVQFDNYDSLLKYLK